jgi:hypothetical protein
MGHAFGGNLELPASVITKQDQNTFLTQAAVLNNKLFLLTTLRALPSAASSPIQPSLASNEDILFSTQVARPRIPPNRCPPAPAHCHRSSGPIHRRLPPTGNRLCPLRARVWPPERACGSLQYYTLCEIVPNIPHGCKRKGDMGGNPLHVLFFNNTEISTSAPRSKRWPEP